MKPFPKEIRREGWRSSEQPRREGFKIERYENHGEAGRIKVAEVDLTATDKSILYHRRRDDYIRLARIRYKRFPRAVRKKFNEKWIDSGGIAHMILHSTPEQMWHILEEFEFVSTPSLVRRYVRDDIQEYYATKMAETRQRRMLFLFWYREHYMPRHLQAYISPQSDRSLEFWSLDSSKYIRQQEPRHVLQKDETVPHRVLGFLWHKDTRSHLTRDLWK